ncbi:MAG: hypothetical protein JWO02_2241 [Solirubrobacterales bacterium]|nr:hypothetical protein [Solirubrobacterales bacterium]
MPSSGDTVPQARFSLRLFTALLTAATLVMALATQAASAAVPDPTADGPYEVVRQRYEAGSITLQDPGSPGQPATFQREAFKQYIRGVLHYPASGTGPWPVVVNVHGNHSSCWDGVSLATGHVGTYRANQATGAECAFATGSNTPAPAGYVPLPNDEGYDYIAGNLASHGYLVISIDQDELMAHQPGDDRGMYMRSQLISAHLDALYNANQGLPSGNLPATLAGKIDLTRIGLQGHSRGGDGVTNFIDYNRTRPVPGRRYPIKAVLAIAPVDYERRAPYGVAFATILPLCDGDVSNVQGARFFERSQYVKSGDPFPRIQFNLHGTDHNYFNTSWVDDDGASYTRDPTLADGTGTNTRDLACGEKVLQVTQDNGAVPPVPLVPVPSGIRLTQGDQRKTGLAIEAAFMRRYVGGETAFEPYMTGESGLPAAACKAPGNPGVPCAQELSTNYFDAPGGRLDVLRPDNGNPLTVDALGGTITGSGFSNPYKDAAGVAPDIGTPTPADTPGGYDWCNPEPLNFVGSFASPPLADKPCPLPALDAPAGVAASGSQRYEREQAPVNRSYGNQLALAWDHPATLSAQIPVLNGDVSRYKTLALSAAVNYFDLRNEQRTPANASDPAAVTQDFDVVLTDAAGHEASVAAGDPRYGNALQPSLGAPYAEGGQIHRGRRHIVLEQVRIPTGDFAGVDLTSVRKVEFRFGARRATGSIQLSDVRFQEAPHTDATDDVSKYAAKSPPPGVAVATQELAAPGVLMSELRKTGACSDLASPTSAITKLTATRTSVRATGRSTDVGCSGATTVPAKVYAAFTKVGKTVRYGKLAGRSVWSLTQKRALTKGTYVLRVRAADKAGNLAPAISRTVHVR